MPSSDQAAKWSHRRETNTKDFWYCVYANITQAYICSFTDNEYYQLA